MYDIFNHYNIFIFNFFSLLLYKNEIIKYYTEYTYLDYK